MVATEPLFPHPFPLLREALGSMDIKMAMSVVAVMQKGDMPIDFEDVVYAYLLSKKCIEQIISSKAQGTPLSREQVKEQAENLDTLRHMVERCERNFDAYPKFCKNAIDELTSGVIALWMKSKNELAVVYVSSLRMIAQYFAKRGDNSFNEILQRKGIDPLD